MQRNFQTCAKRSEMVQYLDIALKLKEGYPERYPYIYQHFLEGKFFVRICGGLFKAMTVDMKLEQSIQCSKKGPGGITGQMKQKAYITERGLFYPEVLNSLMIEVPIT